MNSFSTAFKSRAITLSIAISCAPGVLRAIGLRAYRAHKDKVAANYANRMAVKIERLSIAGVVNADPLTILTEYFSTEILRTCAPFARADDKAIVRSKDQLYPEGRS
jgi:hypothetical protein